MNSVMRLSGVADFMDDLLGVHNKIGNKGLTDENYIFGHELDPSLGKEAIHPFIFDLMKYIYEKGKEVEGIFRVNGKSEVVKDFVQGIELNEGIGYEDDIKELEIHDAASILKQFFLRLKNPILRVAEFGDKVHEELKQNRTKVSKECVGMIKNTMQKKVSKTTKFVIQELVQYLEKFVPFQEKSLMTRANLSLCWAPTIIIPKLSPDFEAEVKLSADLFEVMMVHQQEIFSCEEMDTKNM